MPGVKRERDDSVGVLTLDEPGSLNAMTPDLLGDLASAIGEMTGDARIRALVLARRLAAGPTRALVATRRLVEQSEHSTYAEQFRREIETQAEIRQSADALEGRNAFLKKRAARFSGR